ncbi:MULTISPECIES: RcnB family protein [unclassified Polaromonas]|uniref:RcnB family protein n=1 Tax=unclassified Polaromonas TaxID=2638319 RepID=UPI001E54B010|nr:MULTISPECIES: RcnB family protein [unclassified Polaromonas]
MTTPTTNTSPTNAFLRSHSFTLVMAAALALACSSSFAEKPEWAGGGKNKGNKHDQVEQSDQGDSGKGKKAKKNKQAAEVKVGGYFVPQQRVVVQNYYGQQFKAGKCPPGLAKKNNGCLPPGQAKKYAIGQPLPRDVVFYPVPSSVVVQLGAPPAGHKYVRVATDILLIAVGSNMVVDAIQDLAAM